MRCVACNHSQSDKADMSRELCSYCYGSVRYYEDVDRREKRKWLKEHPAELATAGRGTAAGVTTATMFEGRERPAS
jgi:hypothetical protein